MIFADTHICIPPDRADAAGRLLLALAEARPLKTISTVGTLYAFQAMSADELREVGNALIALGNDTDVITTLDVAEDDEPKYVREHFEEQDRITEVYDEAVHDDDLMSSDNLRKLQKDPDMTEDPFETATVYISKNVPTGWTFNVHYKSDGLVKYFNKLEDGLREHSGDIFYFTEPEQHEVREIFDDIEGPLYRVWLNSKGRYADGFFFSKETAETWKHMLDRAEGVPKCDISPESVIEIDANAAKLVGEMLKQIRQPLLISRADYGDVVRHWVSKMHPALVQDIGDALLELSRDKNVMIVQEELKL